tara:strand:- start:911 stop:1417 length:507 start_codon:yes stop_codon:yes gene_type:complete
MKKIIIKGKHNIDSFKKETKRKNVSSWSYPKEVLRKDNQICILNKLYLGQEFNGFSDVKKEIQNKISSYSQQDKKRNIFDPNKIIGFEQCLEKLVLSKLNCYYCRESMLLMYEDKREPTQWTLDRLNNNIGHHNENVVICCLKCNLKKRRMDDEKFKFTKQLRVIKGF